MRLPLLLFLNRKTATWGSEFVNSGPGGAIGSIKKYVCHGGLPDRWEHEDGKTNKLRNSRR